MDARIARCPDNHSRTFTPRTGTPRQSPFRTIPPYWTFTHPPQVWYGDSPIIGPWRVCFCFPIKRPSSKIRRPKDDLGRNSGQNLGHFAPCKMGATWVECLWIFYEFRWGLHCWYSIGRRLLGRFSSISFGVKKENKYSSKIYRPARPANAGPGGLNYSTSTFNARHCITF